MRVSVFIPNMNVGGAEKVTQTIVNELSKRKFNVELITLNSQGALLSGLNSKVKQVNLGVSRTFYAIKSLSAYLRIEQPDVLVSMLNHSSVIATLSKILSRSSCKLVLVEHSDLTETIKRNNSFATQFIKFLMRILYPYADQIVCVSEGVKNSLIRELHLKENTLQVIYNPVVSLEKLSEPKQAVPNLFTGAGFKLVAAGRLTHAKGFSDLITALSLINKDIQYSLIILGEGELRAELEQQIIDLQLVGKIKLLGYVSDPMPWLQQADLFILSSVWEGLPSVLIEAMSAGTQVVSTDCPSGPSEILEQGRWGKLCAPGSPHILASVIESSLLSPTSFEVEKRAKAFSVKSSIDQYEKLLNLLSINSERSNELWRK